MPNLEHTNQTFLVLSGAHGDEQEVIQCVREYVSHNREKLGAFVYIPEISPTAVRNRTRENAFGNDVNRSFVDTTGDPEARALMEKLRSYRFDLCFDFHEDPDLEADFYMYDSGKLSEQELQRFRTEIQSMGAHLYTGIDTSTDVNLGFSLEQGYASVPQETMSQSSGFLDKWLLDCGLVKRIFTLEIPGKAPLEQKRALVHALFSFFLTMPPANS